MSIAENSLQLKQDFDDVYEAGYEKGKSEGGDTTEAYNEGFEAGKDKNTQDFWDRFQNKGGSKMNYQYAFAYSHYDDSIYNPKYPIKCTDSNTGGRYVFYQSLITDTKVPIYAPTTTISNMFYQSDIKTIRMLDVYETTNFDNAFGGCSKLINIEFGGTIGQDISFVACEKLSDESIQNIIEHLGTTSKTIIFHTDVVSKLTDEQADTILNKGWDIG